MSREHNDELDAMRYATDAWRRTREELLSRPTFCVQGIIDKCQPQISDMIEKGLKRQLLEGIETQANGRPFQGKRTAGEKSRVLEYGQKTQTDHKRQNQP